MKLSANDVHGLGRILGLWAHPDDETWGSAGLMAQAVRNKQPVSVISMTSGDAGQTADESRWPQSQLSKIRRQELHKALACVGVSDYQVLDYADGCLAEADADAAISKLITVINNYKPDTILTFEPEGITGHPDHKTISSWAVAAAQASELNLVVYGAVENTESYDSTGKVASDEFNVYFATEKPVTYSQDEVDLCFNLSAELADKKRRALLAHASQTTHMMQSETGKALLNQACKCECFIKLL